MEIIPLAGMLLALLTLLIIAGSILMFPLTRRLGRLLELRIEERLLESGARQRGLAAAGSKPGPASSGGGAKGVGP